MNVYFTYLFICIDLFAFFVHSQCIIQIESISPSRFSIGKDRETHYDSNYIGLQISNTNSTNLEDVWVSLALPNSQSLQLAPLESGLYRIGALNSNTTKNAYFLLTGKTEGLNFYTATVYETYPSFNKSLNSATFNVTITHTFKYSSTTIKLIL